MAEPRLVILGAGRPFAGTTHSALRVVDRNTVVLDWILHAFEGLRPRVSFVAGYEADKVISRGPKDVVYVINDEWRDTGSVGSLLKVDLVPGAPHYVCYSDIVFGRDVVDAMEAQDPDAVVVAVDSSPPAMRDPERSAEAARKEKVVLDENRVLLAGTDAAPRNGGAVTEFVGLMRVPPGVVERVEPLVEGQPPLGRQHLSALVEALRREGTPIVAVDVAGRWSDLNSSTDLTNFILGTKAETLARLRGLVRNSVVDPQVTFRVSDWRTAPDRWTEACLELPGERLVTRSSALTEDSFESANAGRFDSVLGVERTREGIAAAVETVIASFDDDGLDHQVLVQPMVEDVRRAGVVLTRALHTGAAYYKLSFTSSADTTAVTSGAASDATTWVLHRDLADEEGIPDAVGALLASVREIETLLEYDSLDIEFAESQGGEIHLLQVRPLVLDHDRTVGSELEVRRVVEDARRRFDELAAPRPGVLGSRPVWSCMSDWNPAEIIGVVPSRLAFSLYRELVTDRVWARQRAEFGYREVLGAPLVRLFAGHAFVDVRASLNSFIPASLPDDVAERVVELATDRLAARPDLHDKIEFEVVPTCFDFDFDRWRDVLGGEGGLSDPEFGLVADAYRALTANGMARLGTDEAALSGLADSLDRRSPGLEGLRGLLDAARAHGTLPFAHLARHAFIAVSLLRSAVTAGALDEARMQDFLRSVHTVSGEFVDDAWRVRSGDLEWAEFAARYGHLRPGTYDITSRSYGADPDQYLTPVIEQATEPSPHEFAWSADEAAALERLLADARLGCDLAQLEAYLRRAIEGRERAKFLFTRHVSLVLDEIAAVGEEHGVELQHLAEVSLSELLDARDGALTATTPGEYLEERGRAGLAARTRHSAVILPSVLLSRSQFAAFQTFPDEPTFVTRRSVTARVVEADTSGAPQDLDGAVVVVERADPGWDWLFGHRIAGLITAYGGSNSHMAIRAAEFDLPAAIGVGPERYAQLVRARTLELDCARRRITAG